MRMNIGDIIFETHRIQNITDDFIILENKVRIPKHCGCNKEISFDDQNIYCELDFNCQHKLQILTEKFLNTLKIDYIKPEQIEKLIKANLIKNPYDIFLIKEDELTSIGILENEDLEKFINGIRKPITITPEILLSSFLIHELFNVNVERLFSKISWKDFLEYEYNDQCISSLCGAIGIDKNIAKKILIKLENIKNHIKYVLTNIPQIIIIEPTKHVKEKKNVSLSGLSFCVTGKLNTLKSDGTVMTRNDIYKLIKEYGGEIKDSVKPNLSYLISNNPNSNSWKIKMAKKLGIPIINETLFINMIKN